jgi:hypothetical protein
VPLLVLFEKNPTEETLKKEKELIEKIVDPNLKSDLISVAITVASRKFTRDFLYRFFI